jgi:anti-sigma factor RsiW
MTEHDELREWDAAYVLGALSADDRRRFERHLAECQDCAASLSELAGLPALLGTVTAAEAEASLGRVPQPAPNLLPRLMADVARRRRRTRRIAVGLSIGSVIGAAAVGALVVPGVVSSVVDPAPSSVTVQLERVTPSPLSASVSLIEQGWGTRIDVECRYDGGRDYAAAADYAMYVTDADGQEARIATWAAAPGQTVTPSASTSLSVDEIRSVDVRAVSTGEVLLRGSP